MDLTALAAQIQQILHEEILRTLAYLGEQCVKRARDRSAEESWIDQTGNLRSSIGFAVFAQGQQAIASAFEQVAGPKGSGDQGAVKGRAYIDQLAQKYSDTYALVVVAGMDYASYVEAKDNKDVLASTELWARAEVDKYMQKAIERAIKRIDRIKITI